VVRRLAGYGRLNGLTAAGALERLYESAHLYVNFFQPSFKLASKQRNAAQVHKPYYPPLTPFQRLLRSDAVDESVKKLLREQFAVLDPVALLKAIPNVQQQLSEANCTAASVVEADYLDAFATAWHGNHRALKGEKEDR
jgi:hypothetical protein